jgi:hypothetical protein
MGTAARMQAILKPASYPKRHKLFAAPNETWDGTADSTKSLASNLEIVTKPMTSDMWLEEGGAAQQDADALTSFIEKLSAAPQNVFTWPKVLQPDLKIFDANAVLFRTGEASTEVQATEASRMAPAITGAPEWWLPGLNWKSYIYLKNIIKTIDTASVPGSNPKNMWPILQKRPMLQNIGRARVLTSEMRAMWVAHVAEDTLKDGVRGLERNAIQNLYNIQKTKGEYAIEAGDFTWREYLEGLLSNRDLVTDYARDVWGGENMGLGQLSDVGLHEDWVIEEHRQDTSINSRNILGRARKWGRKAQEDM